MSRPRAMVLIGALALASCGKKDAPAAPPRDGAGAPAGSGAASAAADPRVLARGAYLANLAGCPVCHTSTTAEGPDASKLYAGGLEATSKLADGRSFAWHGPNLTPDPETGLGKWTDAQIVTAIREGVRPDGRRLAPTMPYQVYNRLTDADAAALVAFLRSLAPIANKVEAIDNSAVAATVGPAPNLPVASDMVAQGEYVASLMLCAMCHTPAGPHGPELSKAFAGGSPMELLPMPGTGVLHAPNITSDPTTGIGTWSGSDIMRAIRGAVRPDGRPIVGPMTMFLPQWAAMTDDDSASVVEYIKAIPAVVNKVPPSTFKPSGPPGDPTTPPAPPTP